MDERIITSDVCVAEGASFLAKAEPRFAYALDQTGPLPLRLKSDGFETLFSAIVSQQVSVASANAIWARVEQAGLTVPDRIKQASDEDLRACGLSRPKVRYARALAEAQIDFDELRMRTSAQVIETLVKVSGIGRWTAEIYAMFSLGRADVFAPNDLALQEAAKNLFDLPARPTEKELRLMSEAWAPWRSVAARLLFSYYRILKSKEGIR